MIIFTIPSPQTALPQEEACHLGGHRLPELEVHMDVGATGNLQLPEVFHQEIADLIHGLLIPTM